MSESKIAVADLSRAQAEVELERLAREMAHHDRLYYLKDDPEISDADYDALRIRNQEIEARFPELQRPDSPSLRVGAPPLDGFEKVKHQIGMLSLGNAFSAEDVQDFEDSVRRFLKLDKAEDLFFTAEPKIDGLSIALIYENGLLVTAATRGDGKTGEDVTANIRTIQEIPLSVEADDFPAHFEIRGEIYMARSEFDRLNADYIANDKKPFANPRNAAAGSLRQLDSRKTAKRKLRLFAYAWGAADSLPAQTQFEVIQAFGRWGFPINPLMQVCKGAKEMLGAYQKIEQARDDLDYEIDGVVYKVNSLALQDRLGLKSRSPRWAIAHKFAAEQVSTRLNAIEIQVGRSGALTPVGRLDPVVVGGVEVSNATLHNEDEIVRKDIREGDMVVVQRAGDVIPQIVEVLLDQRPENSKPFVFPDHCPACNHPAVREFNDKTGRLDARRVCTGGLKCSAQILERLSHFVSRDAYDIDGLGPKQIEALNQAGLVLEPADIFTLERRNKDSDDKIEKWKGWGEKSVEKMFRAIDSRRSIALNRFIYGLGIPVVGRTVSMMLAKDFGTFDAFEQRVISLEQERPGAAYFRFMAISGLGEKRLGLLREALAKAGDIELRPAPKEELLSFAALFKKLGVKGIGKVYIEKIAAAFDDVEDFMSCAKQLETDWPGEHYRQFSMRDGIGTVVTDTLIDFYADQDNRAIVERLRAEVTPEPLEIDESQMDSVVAGKTVVFTGKMELLSRNEAKAQAERLGAKVSGSVSKKTDFLVAGPGAGSKLKKAEAAGVTILSEQDWLDLVQGD